VEAEFFPACRKYFSSRVEIVLSLDMIRDMYNWKQLFAGLAISIVITLSSVPLIHVDFSSSSSSTDYCTTAHGKSESGCKEDKAHHCVWCVSRAVPGMCYDDESAHQLPPSVFKCDFVTTESEAEELETA